MRVLWLVLYMGSLLPPDPSTWDDDVRLRWALAEAIVAVTDDVEEQLTLARIPRFESAYRRDVADCRVRGTVGEVTAWQILARSRKERAGLCVSLVDDARVALERVRESVRACARNVPEYRLALYTRGRCDSVEGQRLAKNRYPGRHAVWLAHQVFAREGKEGTTHERTSEP